MPSPLDTQVGGGLKKVLATLKMARDAGWQPTAKALTANNTCKACGLGMGGQAGGMTNELAEFPSVCNKSVQAQSSDLQPPIPHEVFDHSLAELGELDERELNRLGRLANPLFKYAHEDRYRPIEWDEAMRLATQRLRATAPERTFFYSSGRSSNEAGFILQLFARLYGTNNVNNCSYYCDQATSEGLGRSIGTGTATVELADLGGTDFVFLLGANPASNHPRFVYQLQDVRARGGHVVVINPAKESGLVRFAMPKSPRSLIAGGSEIASLYVQPNIGSDVVLLQGIAKAVLAQGGADVGFISEHSRGFSAYKQSIETLSWTDITARCGVDRREIERVAEAYCACEHAVFAWGMGLTHHVNGVDNIEEVANLAILRGMVGKRHAGLLPLRGHSNVQGIGTIGVKPILAQDVMLRIEEELGVELPKAPGLDTMAAMQAAHDGRIDAALMMGGNLYAASPNATWAAHAMAQIPFKIFMTTSLNGGHLHGQIGGESLVLPVTPRDEEWQSTTQESMFNFVRLSDGGITRHANVRPESSILSELAERVLDEATLSRVDFARFRKHQNVREAIARTVPGLEQLASIDVAKQEFHVAGRLLHEPHFPTADHRCHFRVHTLPASDEQALPFTLATVRSEGQFNTIVYEEEDSYRGVPTRWSVLLSPRDMERLDIETGDRVTLRSLHGVMRDVQAYPFDLPAGNALAYFPEANVLIGTDVDPVSRTPSFKATRIAIVTNTREVRGPRPAPRHSI